MLNETSRQERQTTKRNTTIKGIMDPVHKAPINRRLIQLRERLDENVILHHTENLPVRVEREGREEGFFEFVVEYRSDDGDTKDLAERADELDGGGDGGHVFGLHGGLDRDGVGLVGEADAETAEHEDKDCYDPGGGFFEEDAERCCAHEDEVPHGWEECKCPLLHHPDSGSDRGDDDADDKGDGLEASDGGGFTQNDLEVNRKVENNSKEGHAAEEDR